MYMYVLRWSLNFLKTLNEAKIGFVVLQPPLYKFVSIALLPI